MNLSELPDNTLLPDNIRRCFDCEGQLYWAINQDIIAGRIHFSAAWLILCLDCGLTLLRWGRDQCSSPTQFELFHKDHLHEYARCAWNFWDDNSGGLSNQILDINTTPYT
jgi:hypothetical protein